MPLPTREELLCLKDMLQDKEEKVYRTYKDLQSDIYKFFGVEVTIERLKELEL